MRLWELVTIAVALSMDAFAVAICKGLSLRRVELKHAVVTGAYFGAFQGLMPFIGYQLGRQFQGLITSVDHWIAFVLLGFIGFHMIRESREEGERVDDSFAPRAMLPLALATSIDALAVGVTFAFLGVEILPAVSLIGVITFSLSAVGVKIGNLFGSRYRSRAELFGGVVLILIGTKIQLEHLGIL